MGRSQQSDSCKEKAEPPKAVHVARHRWSRVHPSTRGRRKHGVGCPVRTTTHSHRWARAPVCALAALPWRSRMLLLKCNECARTRFPKRCMWRLLQLDEQCVLDLVTERDEARQRRDFSKARLKLLARLILYTRPTHKHEPPSRCTLPLTLPGAQADSLLDELAEMRVFLDDARRQRVWWVGRRLDGENARGRDHDAPCSG